MSQSHVIMAVSMLVASQTTTQYFRFFCRIERVHRDRYRLGVHDRSQVCLLWFGLAGSYASAAAARAVGGFFNGIIAAWKCMIGESYDQLAQGRIFGFMALSWSMGLISGMVRYPALRYRALLCPQVYCALLGPQVLCAAFPLRYCAIKLVTR